MNVTGFGGKNRLAFSVRAVNKCSSDHLSNFSPAPRAVLTFPGSLPWQPDICGVCAAATGPRHRCSDRSVGEASAVVVVVGGFQTETGLWQALRSDTWMHSMARSDGGRCHGDQSVMLWGALEM